MKLKEKQKFIVKINTPEFMTITISEGNSPSRKTDLEELNHTLIFLLKKTLPWSNIKGKFHADTCRKMCNKKNYWD